MGIIRKCALLIFAAYLAMTGAMLAWTFLWPEPATRDLEPVDAIVCLGGGITLSGVPTRSVMARIDRCVELFDAGLAPVVIFTGGAVRKNGPVAGTLMSLYAQRNGLPETAAIVEPRAQSTVQNAIFSFDEFENGQSFILVTEAFHMPRSWASFRWASWQRGDNIPRTFKLVMSEPVRRDPRTGAVDWTILARESAAIWFNAARVTAYTLAPNPSIDWLH